ncbi:MAG TPA: M28 family peptidase, partial [Euryarchaeota archaeon]|nr:M28 family peptidase [Euryarchaeota archaeon]
MRGRVGLVCVLIVFSQFGLSIDTEGSSPLPAKMQYADLHSMVYDIEKEDISLTILHLQNFMTRHISADNNTLAAQYIADRFSRVGLDVEMHEFTHYTYTLENVIATLPGTDPTSDEVYIVVAHFDSTSGQASTLAPGANDNGSGTAAMMVIAEIMAQYRWNNTVKFIAFNAEEVGLRGSKAYALREANAGSTITGVFNLDMIGFPNGDNILEVAYTNESKYPGLDSYWMYEALYDATVKHSININVTSHLKGSTFSVSDHHPFWENGYDAVLGIEKIQVDYPHYHTIHDTLDKLNITYTRDVTRTVMGAMGKLAGINSTDVVAPSHSFEYPPPGSYVWESEVNVTVEVTDPSGINISSINMQINGTDVAFGLSWASLGYKVYSGPVLFSEGSFNEVFITAKDIFHNEMTYLWNFTVDTIPPEPPSDLAIDTQAGSIHISWSPSPSEDLDHYRVFMSNRPDNFDYSVVFEYTNDTSFTHSGEAGNNGVKYYKIHAVDRAGHFDSNDVVLGKSTISLEQGWNMVGIVQRQHDTDVKKVFDYHNHWNGLQSYNAQYKTWEFYEPNIPPWYSQIENVDKGDGMWMRVTIGGTRLCLTGIMEQESV